MTYQISAGQLSRAAAILALVSVVALLSGCTPKPQVHPEAKPRATEVSRRVTSGIIRDWLTDFKPFSAHPAVDYYVADSVKVLLVIKNEQGKPMDTLVNQWRGKGLYTAGWHTDRGWTNGVYYYEFKAGEIKQTKQTVLKFAEVLEQSRK